MTFANIRGSTQQNSDDLQAGCSIFMWLFVICAVLAVGIGSGGALMGWW